MHPAGMEYLLDDTFFDLVNLSKEALRYIQDRVSRYRGDFVEHFVVVYSTNLECASSNFRSSQLYLFFTACQKHRVGIMEFFENDCNEHSERISMYDSQMYILICMYLYR